jgi:hypothetical protein
MPVGAFNPFNPFSYFGYIPSRPIYARQPRLPASTPIAIKAGSSDPGISIKAGKNEVTIKGTMRGPKVQGMVPYTYSVARGVSFTLDIEKAPTVDVFGKTDYTEKNSRGFGVDSRKGWGAEEVARRLAAKVNAQDDFRATVKVAADGSATVSFARR